MRKRCAYDIFLMTPYDAESRGERLARTSSRARTAASDGDDSASYKNHMQKVVCIAGLKKMHRI
jgi:hypothetical protein